MLIEAVVLSGIAAAIAWFHESEDNWEINTGKPLYRKPKPTDQLIETTPLTAVRISVEKEIMEPPMYWYVGTSITGLNIPLGKMHNYTKDQILAELVVATPKGKKTETFQNASLLDFHTHKIKRYFLNNPDSVKHFVQHHGLDPSHMPIRLPLKVEEIVQFKKPTLWCNTWSHSFSSSKADLLYEYRRFKPTDLRKGALIVGSLATVAILYKVKTRENGWKELCANSPIYRLFNL